MSNWKGTKDELPKDYNTEVLFRVNSGYVFLGTWDKENEVWEDDSSETMCFDSNEVVAWCPIPKYDLND